MYVYTYLQETANPLVDGPTQKDLDKLPREKNENSEEF